MFEKLLSYQNKTESVVTPLQELVLYYKELTGCKIEDKKWDKIYFPKYVKTATEILLLCDYDLDKAKKCIKYTINYCNSKGLDYTLHTVIKYIPKYFTLLERLEKERKPASIVKAVKTAGSDEKEVTLDEAKAILEQIPAGSYKEVLKRIIDA